MGAGVNSGAAGVCVGTCDKDGATLANDNLSFVAPEEDFFAPVKDAFNDSRRRKKDAFNDSRGRRRKFRLSGGGVSAVSAERPTNDEENGVLTEWPSSLLEFKDPLRAFFSSPSSFSALSNSIFSFMISSSAASIAQGGLSGVIL